MEISKDGLKLIASFEGYRPIAYQDIAGVWTIGYGHTSGVQEGDQCTAEQALSWLREDAASSVSAVNYALQDTQTTQNEFDAMVSLAFNIGCHAFASSSVIQFHCAGLSADAGDAFMLWDNYHHDGILCVSVGLKRRRSKERGVYLNALYA